MGALIAFIVSYPVFAALDGWLVSLLWGWFVVPFGAPPLGLAWAIGLMCLVSFCISSRTDTDGTWTEVITYTALKVVLTLGVGYTAHYFMPHVVHVLPHLH
jgi:hypothetical protein